jgi:hypothetical protein
MPSSSDTNSETAPDNKDDVDTKPEWRQVFDQLTSNPLQKVGAAAERWITLLATLVGVSTIVGLFQGHDSFIRLSLIAQTLLLTAVFLALFTLGIAIYFATKASEGTVIAMIPLDKVNFIQWYRTTLLKALNYLRTSRMFGIASIVFVVLSLCINLLAPGQTAPETNILAVQKSGVIVCGTLTKDGTGNLLLSRVGLPPIILKDIISFNTVSGCP